MACGKCALVGTNGGQRIGAHAPSCRKGALAELIAELRRNHLRASAEELRERRAYAVTAPPSNAANWLANVASRRYRLALWVLKQTGTVLGS